MYLPVEVRLGELVGEALVVVVLKAAGVVQQVVVCWGHRALAHRLGHQVEVIPAHCHTYFIRYSDIFPIPLLLL